ncbi:MAG: hypothetical protein FD180_2491 [Planctomycetota bacterium]|nr:MAG: hypothetical protein FD180_2491 [Planctomycetota bacterium]
MPVNVTCDHCGQSLQVLEEHAGKQVRCPKCYQVFVAKISPGVAPAAVAGPAPTGGESVPVSSPSPAGGLPPAVSSQAKFCPHCGIALQAAAGFCTSCGKAPLPGTFAPAGSFPAPYGAPARTNGLSTASLVLVIVSWTCMIGGPLFAIPGVICGHLARGQIRNSNGTQTGDSLALVGLVLGYLNLLVWFGYAGFIGIASMGRGGLP